MDYTDDTRMHRALAFLQIAQQALANSSKEVSGINGVHSDLLQQFHDIDCEVGDFIQKVQKLTESYPVGVTRTQEQQDRIDAKRTYIGVDGKVHKGPAGYCPLW